MQPQRGYSLYKSDGSAISSRGERSRKPTCLLAPPQSLHSVESSFCRKVAVSISSGLHSEGQSEVVWGFSSLVFYISLSQTTDS